MKNMLNNLCFFRASATIGRTIWIHSNLILWVASCSKTKVQWNDKSYCRKLKENKNIIFPLILYFYILNPQLKPSENSCALECPRGSRRMPCTAQLASEDMHRGRWNFHLLPWGRNTRFINNIWNRTCKKGCYESLLSQLPRDLFCWVEALVLKLSTEHGSQFLQTNTKWFNLWLKAWGIDCLLWRCIFFTPALAVDEQRQRRLWLKKEGQWRHQVGMEAPGQVWCQTHLKRYSVNSAVAFNVSIPVRQLSFSALTESEAWVGASEKRACPSRWIGTAGKCNS